MLSPQSKTTGVLSSSFSTPAGIIRSRIPSPTSNNSLQCGCPTTPSSPTPLNQETVLQTLGQTQSTGHTRGRLRGSCGRSRVQQNLCSATCGRKSLRFRPDPEPYLLTSDHLSNLRFHRRSI